MNPVLFSHLQALRMAESAIFVPNLSYKGGSVGPSCRLKGAFETYLHSFIVFAKAVTMISV